MTGPRKFDINFDWGDFWPNFKLVLKVLGINSIIIASLIILTYCWHGGGNFMVIINKYRMNYQRIYFAPFNKGNLFIITWYWSLLPAINEETIFRGPLYIALKHKFRLKIYKDITIATLIILSMALNFLWISWPTKHTIDFPIFMAGLPWYWLVFKTKKLWPAIFCHFMANISIYFVVQLLIYMGFASLAVK